MDKRVGRTFGLGVLALVALACWPGNVQAQEASEFDAEYTATMNVISVGIEWARCMRVDTSDGEYRTKVPRGGVLERLCANEAREKTEKLLTSVINNTWKEAGAACMEAVGQ